jgi:sulfur-carrier protein
MAVVRIPAALRYLAEGQSECAISGETLGDVVRGLVYLYPGLGPRLLGDDGKMVRGLLVLLGGENGRAIAGDRHVLPEDAVITVYPLVAGG